MIKAVINGRIVLPERIIDGNILISGERIVAAGAVRLAFEAMLLIQNLKRTEQIIRGIVRKGQAVGAVVDEAIFC